MRPIPQKLRDELTDDPRMKKCAVNIVHICSPKIEWHHVWHYGNRQINEKWAIIGICENMHKKIEDPRIKRLTEKISLSLATVDDLAKYPKKDWEQIKKYLKNYGR